MKWNTCFQNRAPLSKIGHYYPGLTPGTTAAGHLANLDC